MANPAISGMPYDVMECFCGYRSSPFCSRSYKNIQLVCLIVVKVLIKIKINSIDTLSKLLTCVFGEAAVDGFFYSRSKFKLPFFFQFLTWKWLVSYGNHATISNITISNWFEMFLVSNSIFVLSKVNHTWIIFPWS